MFPPFFSAVGYECGVAIYCGANTSVVWRKREPCKRGRLALVGGRRIGTASAHGRVLLFKEKKRGLCTRSPFVGAAKGAHAGAAGAEPGQFGSRVHTARGVGAELVGRVGRRAAGDRVFVAVHLTAVAAAVADAVARFAKSGAGALGVGAAAPAAVAHAEARGSARARRLRAVGAVCLLAGGSEAQSLSRPNEHARAIVVPVALVEGGSVEAVRCKRQAAGKVHAGGRRRGCAGRRRRSASGFDSIVERGGARRVEREFKVGLNGVGGHRADAGPG